MSPAVDRSTAIQSIRPVYADRILDATKTVEFRRKPLPASVKQVLIWRTGKGGGIVGSYQIWEQITERVSYWCEAAAVGRRTSYGIPLHDLIEYAGGYDQRLTGIEVYAVVPYVSAVSGSALGIDRAPQSWRYAPTGWQDIVNPPFGSAA